MKQDKSKEDRKEGYDRSKRAQKLANKMADHDASLEDWQKSRKKYNKEMDKKKNQVSGEKPAKLEQKSKQRVEKDYARNAIHDYETGHKSEANYEKKKELEVAAGEMHGYFASASKVHKHGKGRS